MIEQIPYGALTEEVVKRAPSSGRILAYFQKKVLDERYRSREDLRQKLLEGDSILLEIHLFNRCQEVRAIWSRRVGAYIYHQISLEGVDLTESNPKIMLERTATDKGIMTVVNLLSYDENGMIKIRDFCLLDEEAKV